MNNLGYFMHSHICCLLLSHQFRIRESLDTRWSFSHEKVLEFGLAGNLSFAGTLTLVKQFEVTFAILGDKKMTRVSHVSKMGQAR